MLYLTIYIRIKGGCRMKINELSTITDKVGLTNPGDKMTARITPKGNKVVTVEKNKGKNKYSATIYENGTIHETRTTKPN